MNRTTLPGLLPERSTRVVTLKLRKEDGTPVQPATIVVWLKDGRSGQPINGRTEQDVLGVNGGTLGADGAFTLRLAPADLQIIDPTCRAERHVLLLRYTWGTDGQEHHEVVMWVSNMANVV